MFDKFKKRHRAPEVDVRTRRQIAREAARRMHSLLVREDGSKNFKDATEAEYYAAKRKAAAVLGHTVRPGDLPSDAEVRAAIHEMTHDQALFPDENETEGEATLHKPSDHLDRFAIYKMRLEPLGTVQQNPKWHPEGDALYHSLQVFEKARAIRPYDKEFLLAALLHDVGKAIEPHDHVGSGLTALEGTLTERTFWLIEHHMDLLSRPDRPTSPKIRALIDASDYREDLALLRDCDEAGREVGVPVATIDEALAYLRGLESEDSLDR